nr:MAG TPA_asm: hypothetical protein [Caudoviricetes sp.]
MLAKIRQGKFIIIQLSYRKNCQQSVNKIT